MSINTTNLFLLVFVAVAETEIHQFQLASYHGSRDIAGAKNADRRSDRVKTALTPT